MQFPAPSHLESAVLRLVFVSQDPALQTTLVPQYRHAPAPSQTPLRPQLSIVSGPHDPWAGAESLGSGLQVPTDPVWLHDLHGSLQSLLQHTPSAQEPLMHSPS